MEYLNKQKDMFLDLKNSSNPCNVCNYINQDLTLKHREWTCEFCGTHHNRDVNAANNILKQGLNILSGYGTQSDTKQKQVEANSLELSMKPEAKPIASGVCG